MLYTRSTYSRIGKFVVIKWFANEKLPIAIIRKGRVMQITPFRSSTFDPNYART